MGKLVFNEPNALRSVLDPEVIPHEYLSDTYNHLVAFHSDADGVASAAAVMNALQVHDVPSSMIHYVAVQYNDEKKFWETFGMLCGQEKRFVVHIVDYLPTGSLLHRIASTSAVAAMVVVDHHYGVIKAATERRMRGAHAPAAPEHTDYLLHVLSRIVVPDIHTHTHEGVKFDDQYNAEFQQTQKVTEYPERMVYSDAIHQTPIFGAFYTGMAGCELAWRVYGCIPEWSLPKHAEGEHRRYVPDVVAYIGDRDIWRWSMPNSEGINAALRTLFNRFKPVRGQTWKQLIESMLETILNAEKRKLFQDWSSGGTYLSMYLNSVAESVARNIVTLTYDRDMVPHAVTGIVLNGIAEEAHEIAHYIIENAEALKLERVAQTKSLVVIKPRYTQGFYTLSFQSTEGCRISANAHARHFGGNGHQHASGAQVPMQQLVFESTDRETTVRYVP